MRKKRIHVFLYMRMYTHSMYVHVRIYTRVRGCHKVHGGNTHVFWYLSMYTHSICAHTAYVHTTHIACTTRASTHMYSDVINVCTHVYAGRV